MMGLNLGGELFPPAFPVESVGRLGRRNRIMCGGVSKGGTQAAVLVEFLGEPTDLWPKPYAVFSLHAELDSTTIVDSNSYYFRDQAMDMCFGLLDALPYGEEE